MRLEPTSCSRVMTLGPDADPALEECLCALPRGAETVRSAPRSCSAVSSSRVTRAVCERPGLLPELGLELEGGLALALLAAIERAA